MTTINIMLSEEQLEGTQATVNQWLHKVGDRVEKNQPLIELETDKVMMEIVAPETGELTEVFLNSGDPVDGQTVLGAIDTAKSTKSATKNNTASNEVPKQAIREANSSEQILNSDSTPSFEVPSSKNNSLTNKNKFISPAVRRLINSNNLNLNFIQGTGKNNRVTSRDVLAYLKTTPANDVISSQHIPISNMRKNIAKHMVQSLLHTAPHVTSVFNLDLSKIIAHRKINKVPFAEQNAKLTFTAYFIAASALAIKSVPLINSQLHEESIEVFNNINIGIGTALADEGLIVPVIKNCENKDLFTIATNLTELTEKARNNKLSPKDVQDGTFTISNHGVSGSLIATPIIINQPQSAILGIGKMEKRVVVKQIDNDDVMTIKPMCYVSLTIDHRVLDAHQTNQFLAVFVDILENWK